MAAVRDDPGGRQGGRWSRGAEGSSRRGLTALASSNGLRPADVHSVDKPRRVHDVLENLAAGGGNVTVDDHFELVASVYDSLRTTDEGPVRGMLPDGSLLAASDVSAAMLAELQAGHNGRAPVAPLRCTAEELPVRTGSLDLATAVNSVHHFDLGRFLAEVARALRAGGQLFVYTRTPEQNARTIWGRWFPGFAKREQRLHSEAT